MGQNGEITTFHTQFLPTLAKSGFQAGFQVGLQAVSPPEDQEARECAPDTPSASRPQDGGPQGDKPQDGRLQDDGPFPRSPQREKQRKKLSDDTFVATAAATVNMPKTPTSPEEETTSDDIYFDASDAMNSAIFALTSEPASSPSSRAPSPTTTCGEFG
jgi:hypothetical protein